MIDSTNLFSSTGLHSKDTKTSSSKSKVPLLPKAVAVWMVDNTSLTFRQIAECCGIHYLEVQLIADGEVNVIGCNPITTGQITEEEINYCQNNPDKIPKLSLKSRENISKKGFRYTPIARRRDKPDAICWIMKYCPEMSDAQIVKLIGTTKSTINSIRNKFHWKMSSIKPRDPVLLGLCTQGALDDIVTSARITAEKVRRLKNIVVE